MRAVFHEQDDAEAVVVRLRREGWDAMVVRDRFAGEDDDEDHPWAVVSDAPGLMLEVLVDAHDGWLDEGEEQGPPLPPLDLPASPRRIKKA